MLTLPTSRRTATGALLGLCLLAATVLLSACGSSTGVADQKPFPSYNKNYVPKPDEYSGPLFKLSQSYPTQLPSKKELPAFFKTNFRKDWHKYLIEARRYCFEGNIQTGWHVQKNKVRHWYHMPWQDWGIEGREAIHGLTREAPMSPFQIGPEQEYSAAYAYAIGFYNSFGGYTIGRVWRDHNHPDYAYASTKGFPVGTVVCKLLFLNMPSRVTAKIPSLKTDPTEWKAYTEEFAPNNKRPKTTPKRKVQEIPLLQMDVMVRDERASAGWVFGTYQYNGALHHRNRWYNLVPVGLMWGNDPGNRKSIPSVAEIKKPEAKKYLKTPINPELQETVINPSDDVPSTHLGWNGRLNGPADNRLSSCASCHMTASASPNSAEPKNPAKSFSPPLSGLFAPEKPEHEGPESENWWMQWFQNVGWKKVTGHSVLEKFMNAEYSTDFSLQLSKALGNFFCAHHQEKCNKSS